MNNIDKLFELAQEAASNAYAPYSNFKVGSAILSHSGHFYVGCNVENIAYPNGSCAEAGAISAMVVGGDKQIKSLLIYADSQTLITPCGACRQRISEFANKDTIIYLANSKGVQKKYTANELLPNNFKEF